MSRQEKSSNNNNIVKKWGEKGKKRLQTRGSSLSKVVTLLFIAFYSSLLFRLLLLDLTRDPAGQRLFSPRFLSIYSRHFLFLKKVKKSFFL